MRSGALPFLNLSTDTSLDYLGLAIPDEITTAISRTSEIATRPFAMTVGYQGKEANPLEAGKDLRVVTVVTGQYFREGEQLQLTLEAIDVEKNLLVWRESLQVAADDLISLRARVAERVRGDLLPALGLQVGETSVDVQPTDREAYELFLRALAASTDPEPNRQAIGMLNRVVEADSGFASAWAELAVRYHRDGAYTEAGEASLQRAEESADRALALDPELSSASVELILRRIEKGEISAAYLEAERLVGLRPQDAFAHFVRSYSLRYAGLLEASASACDRAMTLDPTDRRLRSCSIAFYRLGRLDRAREFLELDHGSQWARRIEIAMLLWEDKKQAVRDLAAGLETPREFDKHLKACLLGWPPAEHERRIREMAVASTPVADPEQHYWAATLLAYCGGPQPALDQLWRAIRGNYCATEVIEVDPMFSGLRADPGRAAEFQKIVDKSSECQERFLVEIGGL